MIDLKLITSRKYTSQHSKWTLTTMRVQMYKLKKKKTENST